MIHAWQIVGDHLDKFTSDDWLNIFWVLMVVTVLIGVSILKDSVEGDRARSARRGSMTCKAEDVIRKGTPCEPSEGMYDGKPQNYCKHCGRKM